MFTNTSRLKKKKRERKALYIFAHSAFFSQNIISNKTVDD